MFNRPSAHSVARMLATLAVGSMALPAAHAELPSTIRVGLLYSLTGGNAAYGASGLAGSKLAVDEINKAGGIRGRKLELVVADDQTDAAKVVGEALRLTANEKVHVVNGPLSSQLTLAAGPVLTQAKVMNFTSAASTALTPQTLPYLFVIAAPADLEATVMVDYAVDVLKAKSIAWLGDNGALSKTMHKAIQARAEKRQVNLVGAEEYPYRGDDVLPQVLKIRRANPDVLLMHPNTGEDHGLIMRTLNEAKWTVPVVNGAGSPSTPGPAVRVFPDAFKNTANLVYKSWTFCANDAVGQTPLGQFKTRLKAATGADYDKLSQNFASQAYDAIYVFKAAAEATNSVDGRTLAKWIEQNASSIKAVNSPFEASASSHFLLGSAAGTAFALDPDKPRADGLLRRVGC